MTAKNLTTDNLALLPKTAAKLAAAFLVLLPYPYVVAKDVARAPQAKVFSEPETFSQAQRGSTVVILTAYAPPYNPALDIGRSTQAKFFTEPETFTQTQHGTPLGIATNPIVPWIQRGPRAVLVETTVTFRGQRGTLVVLSQPPIAPTSGDVFSSQDTGGWPEIPDVWSPPQRVTSLVLNTFSTYVVARDRRITQARVFSEPEVFIQPQHLNFVINSTFPYNQGTDVTWLAKQAKVFSDPEVFVRPHAPISDSINYKPYATATDIQRARMALYFTDPEVYAKPWPPAFVITNGLVQFSPLEFATTLDIYDYQNGSILVAWGAFNPKPQSYNVYVTPLQATPAAVILRLESGGALLLESGGRLLLETQPLPPPDVFYASTLGLQMVVSGLTVSAYNPSSGVITPSGTYTIKVVAVINGVERGEINRTFTVSPTTKTLTTSMKRLWPFPNTGLD